METKTHIRSEVFKIRSQVTDQDVVKKSKQIFNKIISLPEYQEAPCIYGYMDFNHEVQTWDILTHALNHGKRVAVPKIVGDSMHFYYIHSKRDLSPGFFGILEPTTQELATTSDGLMLMPGVAFDNQRHRIGYGKGFYDRYLADHPILTTVAIAFDFQIFPLLPHEATDQLPQKLVTETTIYN